MFDENQFLEEVSIKFCQTLSDFFTTIKRTDVYNDISLFISKNQNTSIEQKKLTPHYQFYIFFS